MIPAEQKCFTCLEPGCGQVVHLQTQFATHIQTGCMSFTRAYWCPGCKRLYFGGDGENRGDPVMNRQHQGAYYANGDIVYKPLFADERRQLIPEVIACCVEMEYPGFMVTKLADLVASGHAPDCASATDGDSSCTCGNDTAQQFVSEHPVHDEDVL